jgi:hypothetical protein
MDKTVAGLIGAMSALVAAVPGQAAMSRPLTVEAAMEASSYADLLRPIPNALALLRAAAAAQAESGSTAPVSEGEATVQEVQFHHHHHYRRRHYHHHHDRY